MKKQIVLTLVSVLLLSGASFATEMQSCTGESPVAVKAPVGVWVKVTVIFHRPKLDCLKGFGFCFNVNWGIEGGGSVNDERGCPVTMRLESNQLTMQVTEKELSIYEGGTTLPYFEGKTSITLEDPAELPPGITRELGSSTPIVIKPGTYPVSYQNGIYTVIIHL